MKRAAGTIFYLVHPERKTSLRQIAVQSSYSETFAFAPGKHLMRRDMSMVEVNYRGFLA